MFNIKFNFSFIINPGIIEKPFFFNLLFLNFIYLLIFILFIYLFIFIYIYLFIYFLDLYGTIKKKFSYK